MLEQHVFLMNDSRVLFAMRDIRVPLCRAEAND
jgi:hypothetical protein